MKVDIELTVHLLFSVVQLYNLSDGLNQDEHIDYEALEKLLKRTMPKLS